MSPEQPDIVLEERYRTPLNCLKLAVCSVFPAFACLLSIAAIQHGFGNIAWQMYLFYTPFLLFGVLGAGEVIYLGAAMIRNTRGVLRVDGQQLVLQTAYYDKTIALREITGIEEEVQNLSKNNRVGFCIRHRRKGYYFVPYGLRRDEIIELIEMLNKRVAAARRAANAP